MPKAVAFEIFSSAKKPESVHKIEDYTISDHIGWKYTFEVYRRQEITYPKYARFENVAGVYLFINRGANQHGPYRKILYIGETHSFRDRLTDRHEKWADARKKGFTHICVHPTDNHKAIEGRLLLSHNTPLNYKR